MTRSIKVDNKLRRNFCGILIRRQHITKDTLGSGMSIDLSGLPFLEVHDRMAGKCLPFADVANRRCASCLRAADDSPLMRQISWITKLPPASSVVVFVGSRFMVALSSGADSTRNCKWFWRVARLRRIPRATALVHPNHRRGNERPRRKVSRPPPPSQTA